MSGGGATANVMESSNVGSRLTKEVVVTCLVAASGGLLFGYDIGITGGVTTMPAFLEKFFPAVLKQARNASTTVYCVYDSQTLTAFTSSLYIAGLVSSLMASSFTASFGRKFTMLLGGFTFLLGGILTAAAPHVAVLILGRLFLGFGVGFCNQATPLYLAEMAPSKWRGACNTGFHLFIGLGCVISALVNFYAQSLRWGWRLSLGLATVPALMMMIGICFIAESPSSLVERGKLDEAKSILMRVRGVADVDAELNDLVKASEVAKMAKDTPFVSIFRREYRPHLVMSIAIPFFQQASGICVIAFYAPAILSSLGSAQEAALFAAVILGLVNIFSILVSTSLVDRCGRRALLLQGGLQMLFPQVLIALLLEMRIGSEGRKAISKKTAVEMLILMCIFAAGFGWSWGPLSWIIPSEIFPLKIRPIGQSISVAVNFGTTFVLSQTFLAMLCRFKYGMFLVFASWILLMTLFVAFFLPETKAIHIDSMDAVWQKHWFWRRFVAQRLPTSDKLED